MEEGHENIDKCKLCMCEHRGLKHTGRIESTREQIHTVAMRIVSNMLNRDLASK